MNPNNAGETSTFQMAYKGDLRQIQALAAQDQRWVMSKTQLLKPDKNSAKITQYIPLWTTVPL